MTPAASERGPLPGEGARFTVESYPDRALWRLDLAPVELRGPHRLAPADYFAIKALNWSRLKALALGSPLHFRHACEQPERDAAHFILGSATHCAILEPDEFPRRYEVLTDDEIADLAPPRNTTAGKKIFAWYMEAHPDADASMSSDAYKAAVCREARPGKVILPADAYDACLRMRDAVRANPIASAYLRRGAREQSVTWTDQWRVPLKARLDWISESLPAIVEIKTDGMTTEALRFCARAWRMGYFGQGVFQRRGMLATTGRDLKYALIAVESKQPHDVTVFERVDDDSMYQAELQVFGHPETGACGALERFVQCNERGEWPGRYSDGQELKAPRYVFADDEEED